MERNHCHQELWGLLYPWANQSLCKQRSPSGQGMLPAGRAAKED